MGSYWTFIVYVQESSIDPVELIRRLAALTTAVRRCINYEPSLKKDVFDVECVENVYRRWLAEIKPEDVKELVPGVYVTEMLFGSKSADLPVAAYVLKLMRETWDRLGKLIGASSRLKILAYEDLTSHFIPDYVVEISLGPDTIHYHVGTPRLSTEVIRKFIEELTVLPPEVEEVLCDNICVERREHVYSKLYEYSLEIKS